MKKFLKFCVTIFIIFAIFFVFIENSNHLLRPRDYVTHIQGDSIYKGKEKIYIRGVNLDTVKPNHLPGDFAAQKEDYMRWFKDISGMYCNTIKVKAIMPASFYNALYEYNQTHKKPLYIIQGVNISSKDLDVSKVEGEQKKGSLISQALETKIQDTVDIIHGNKTPIFSKEIKERYTIDVSEYTLAYSIDSSLDYSDVIFSEIMKEELKEKNNEKYVYPTKNASYTEKIFAYLGNRIVQYEKVHYRTERLLTFQTSRADIIESLMLQKKKTKNNDRKRYIDLKNIKTKKAFKAGLFASYSMNIENNEAMNYKGGILYQLKLLKEYNPHLPIVISEYAAPTTKAGTQYSDEKEASISEKEQAQMLIKVAKELQKAKVAGDIILEWQDAWYRNTWNVKQKVYQKHAKYWHNMMSYSQSYGLLSFDTSKIYPDNSTKEWEHIPVLEKKDGVDIKCTTDESYMYFLVQGKPLQQTQDVQIALDVTPHSGVTKSQFFNTDFQQPVDFVMNLQQKTGKIYVQEYYDMALFDKNQDKIKINPRYHKSKTKDRFHVVEMKVQNRFYSKVQEKFVSEKYAEVGNLMAADTNPSHENSQTDADFYRGKDYVEVRIPWQMLNFYDPTKKEIIGDVYKNRVVKSEVIDTIGISTKVGNVQLNPAHFTLEPWLTATYKERKKQSYYILKDYFKKEAGE